MNEKSVRLGQGNRRNRLKQMRTGETAPEQMEQHETSNLRARVQKHRAEGKSYRDIAKLEKISIGQISRILNQPAEGEPTLQTGRSTVDVNGDVASRVFEMLEKGTPPTDVVIKLKLHPDKANQLFQKWRELRLEELNPLGYLMLTREEIKEILAIPYQLSATGMQFVLSQNIFENPTSLLRRYDNPNDYDDLARLLYILERVVQRNEKLREPYALKKVGRGKTS
jgi:transposase